MISNNCVKNLIDLFSTSFNLNNDHLVEKFCFSRETLELKAQQEWYSAIAALEKILSTQIKLPIEENQSLKGLVISSPTIVINQPELINSLETVVFSEAKNSNLALMPSKNEINKPETTVNNKFNQDIFTVSNEPENNYIKEQFCLVFTGNFSCLIVKGINQFRQPKFEFSFEPEIINQAWLFLKERLIKNQPQKLLNLEQVIKKFPPINPDYRLVSQFSRYLLDYLKIIELTTKAIPKNLISSSQFSDQKNSSENEIPRKSQSISLKKTPLPPYPEIELLQALTHEIRTPLTTIKTITKLLLRKVKLSPELVKHLEAIEQECNEQINRMELIFRATELETTPQEKKQVKLVPTSLEEILSQTIPCWQKQAQRRNIILDVIVPQKLPQIVSDPAILSQILSGLMEKFTKNLPNGGHFKVLVFQAGNQLKLQFLAETNLNNSQTKCLGKLLLFQPETGSLWLSTDVTKNIFQALGAKLVIKQKPDKGEVLTIFLPLGGSKSLSSLKK